VAQGPDELAELERWRQELYRELAQAGDFRPVRGPLPKTTALISVLMTRTIHR
jgi:hypothetical protein